MSLVSSLMENSIGYGGNFYKCETGPVYEGFLDDAFVNLARDIYAVDEAYMTADIIGSCRIITESADPSVVLEGIISDGIKKLKDAWMKFWNAIKAFFHKVLTFFKTLFMDNEKFVKEYKTALIDKAKKMKDFSYKGYEYDTNAGDALVDKALKAVNAKVESLIGALDDKEVSHDAPLKDAMVARVDVVDKGASSSADNKVLLMNRLRLKAFRGSEDVSASEVADAVVGEIDSSCDNSSDLRNEIVTTYRGGDTEKGTITIGSTEINKMITFVTSANGVISSVKKMRDAYDKKLSAIIKGLDKIKEPKYDATDDAGLRAVRSAASKKYQYASTCSQWLQALLNLYKVPCDTKIQMYKEMIKAYGGALKTFLNFGKTKKVGESVALETEDVDVEDVADDEDVSEATDEPDVTDDDTTSGDDSDNPIEEAMRYLGRRW